MKVALLVTASTVVMIDCHRAGHVGGRGDGHGGDGANQCCTFPYIPGQNIAKSEVHP
jgi:hypothetical protein